MCKLRIRQTNSYIMQSSNLYEFSCSVIEYVFVSVIFTLLSCGTVKFDFDGSWKSYFVFYFGSSDCLDRMICLIHFNLVELPFVLQLVWFVNPGDWENGLEVSSLILKVVEGLIL